MGTPANKLTDLDMSRFLRSELLNVPKEFWMPDRSCSVCYECDSQFTLFNRRHHCRLCGRVFCAKCSANSIAALSDESRAGREDWERMRVCNFCFKQWEQGKAAVDNGTKASSPGLSPSPSATSSASTKSSCTCNSSSSTVGSNSYAIGPNHCVNYNSDLSPRESVQMNAPSDQNSEISGMSTNPSSALVDSSSNHFGFCGNRIDDEDDDYGPYCSDSESRHYAHAEEYYGAINLDEIGCVYGSDKVHPDAENIDAKSLVSPSAKNFDAPSADGIKKFEDVNERENADESEAPAYDVGGTDAEPLELESSAILWQPPEPEDEEDEREAALFDDDDDDVGASGEWGYLHSSNSFGSGECRSRGKSGEEHRQAMKNVVEGHFRALVAQLLQVENLPVGDDDGGESWLDIITSLSWEAATLLKPDTSKGGGMDPGGYVKVKCIASGRRSESAVVKGVVCKKNVAHRRMTSKIDKPRFLILGGALEYQRISNHLSSFDTLLQQEMDHLKMAVAKIDAHHPNVLLVEKSVSRYAQEYLLAKDISLVLNIKRPLLERIARCTGAQIVPSIDHLTSPKLGYCDLFHVEKFLEEHGSAGQDGKKLTKTLMFFEGCPKPLGYTILLKGANGDELKKVKHVVQYGVFAAYHLALETSFLADEGATLPELPLKSPLTVALPDKPSSIDRSISIIPGFTIPSSGKPMAQSINELQKSCKVDNPDRPSFANIDPPCKSTEASSSCLSKGSLTKTKESALDSVEAIASLNSQSASREEISSYDYVPSLDHAFSKINGLNPKASVQMKTTSNGEALIGNQFISRQRLSDALEQGGGSNHADGGMLAAKHLDGPELASSKQEPINNNEDAGSSKEEFTPSASDHQSILVSLSTRCWWKGTVCERSHIFRIKYYGSFDKPLGRFLRDHLFDQSFRCHSCEMPSEAHIHCYTHRQGSLTIAVKKLPDSALPGEREGKIWMWHRCLRCPRINGFPPATRRVVMSDAAWGLSFGKFLELSFSNHAAASRVASCGHSLHRDCLRFYGFGRMVACFRYASIDVHSVYLPPSKLEFNYDNQEWIQSEADEVSNRAEFLFSEVYNALQKISEKLFSSGSHNCGTKAPERGICIEELEAMLQKDRKEFQESLQKVLSKEVKVGQPVIDILEINKLRRQLIFLSYIWDQRLIHSHSSINNNIQEVISSSIPKLGLKPISSVEKLVEMNVSPKPTRVFISCDSAVVETKPDININQGCYTGEVSKLGGDHNVKDIDQEFNNRKEAEPSLSSSANTSEKSDSLESERVVRRAISEGEFPIMENLSDTLEAAWTGESHPANIVPKQNGYSVPDSVVVDMLTAVNLDPGNRAADCGEVEVSRSPQSAVPTKGLESTGKSMSLERMPFPNFYDSFNKNSLFNSLKFSVSEHNPIYVSSFWELEKQNGARLLLPIGVNDTVVPVYDDEPSSIIAYALASSDYHSQMSELEGPKDAADSFSDLPSDTYKSFGSGDDSVLSLSVSHSSLFSDPLLYTKDLHARVSFIDDGPLGKVKYSVTCYYAKWFESLRRTCCPSELDFIRSLSRCKKWDAQGGKSKVFFAKTLDDRFIIKQVTKTELESFIKFGPAYFKYLAHSIMTRSPTCLAKILGIYQVSSKHLKGGKESKMDVLVMENLLFRRNVTRLYDLKGSARSRYNPDTSGSNKVLLDQNLIEAMPTSPIFVGSRAKRLLERAVWNDTSFLALVDVMDYSLLVGMDEEMHELVLGIIDFMRQYTWDKHLETWVKASGILGGAKNVSPTVISPQQYKKRFRKAMTAYFLMVPDQWTPAPTIVPSGSQTDLWEENAQGGNSVG